jgi:hypothetical protein
MARPSGFDAKYGAQWFDGLPFKGAPMDIKKGDPDDKQPVLKRDVKIRQFDTSSPEDMAAWQGVMQQVADGLSVVSFEEKQYVPETKSWRVLVRWFEEYYTNPETPPK